MGSPPIDAVDAFWRNFLAACRCDEDSIPIPTGSFVSATAGHQEDYPSVAVTEYLDRRLEAYREVRCADIRRVMAELRCEDHRGWLAVRLVDELQRPAARVARALRVSERRLQQVRREFKERVCERVTECLPK